MFSAASISPNKSYALPGFQAPVLHPFKPHVMSPVVCIESVLLAHQLHDALPPSYSKAHHGDEIALDTISLQVVSTSAAGMMCTRCRMPGAAPVIVKISCWKLLEPCVTHTLYIGTFPFGVTGPSNFLPGTNSCRAACNRPYTTRMLQASAPGLGHACQRP